MHLACLVHHSKANSLFLDICIFETLYTPCRVSKSITYLSLSYLLDIHTRSFVSSILSHPVVL